MWMKLHGYAVRFEVMLAVKFLCHNTIHSGRWLLMLWGNMQHHVEGKSSVSHFNCKYAELYVKLVI
jgi:hypothetical protein